MGRCIIRDSNVPCRSSLLCAVFIRHQCRADNSSTGV